MGGLGLVWGLMAWLGGTASHMRVVCLSRGWLWKWKPPDDPGTHYPQAMQLTILKFRRGMQGNVYLVFLYYFICLKQKMGHETCVSLCGERVASLRIFI